MATRYQVRLNATHGVTVARTPVLGPAGTVSLNRFVFRRESPAATPRPVPVTRVNASAGTDDLR